MDPFKVQIDNPEQYYYGTGLTTNPNTGSFVYKNNYKPNQAQMDATTSIDMADAFTRSGNNAFQNDYLKAGTDASIAARKFATGEDTIQWKDVKGVGDFGSWLTGNRGGGSNYLGMGLTGLSTAATLYSAYNDNKYKKKMAGIAQQAQDLQNKQYKLYESQVNRQTAKSDAAQAAYDKAQSMPA